MLFLESLGGGELLLILVFILIFFGSKNIPSLARGLGRGIREMKDAMNGVQTEIQKGIHQVENETRKLVSDVDEVKEVAASKPNVQEVVPEIKPEERSASR